MRVYDPPERSEAKAMINPACLRRRLVLLALVTLLSAGGVAHAQGYEVQPWGSGKPTPLMITTDLDGQTWSLADLRGKVVLIHFWASWCEPCVTEMPTLQALAHRHGPQRLVVLAVNYKEEPAAVKRFVARNQWTLPVLTSPDGQLARRWGIRVFPSTVLLGPDGLAKSVVRGELDWSGAGASQLLSPWLPRAATSP